MLPIRTLNELNDVLNFNPQTIVLDIDLSNESNRALLKDVKLFKHAFDPKRPKILGFEQYCDSSFFQVKTPIFPYWCSEELMLLPVITNLCLRVKGGLNVLFRANPDRLDDVYFCIKCIDALYSFPFSQQTERLDNGYERYTHRDFEEFGSAKCPMEVPYLIGYDQINEDGEDFKIPLWSLNWQPDIPFNLNCKHAQGIWYDESPYPLQVTYNFLSAFAMRVQQGWIMMGSCAPSYQQKEREVLQSIIDNQSPRSFVLQNPEIINTSAGEDEVKVSPNNITDDERICIKLVSSGKYETDISRERLEITNQRIKISIEGEPCFRSAFFFVRFLVLYYAGKYGEGVIFTKKIDEAKSKNLQTVMLLNNDNTPVKLPYHVFGEDLRDSATPIKRTVARILFGTDRKLDAPDSDNVSGDDVKFDVIYKKLIDPKQESVRLKDVLKQILHQTYSDSSKTKCFGDIHYHMRRLALIDINLETPEMKAFLQQKISPWDITVQALLDAIKKEMA